MWEFWWLDAKKDYGKPNLNIPLGSSDHSLSHAVQTNHKKYHNSFSQIQHLEKKIISCQQVIAKMPSELGHGSVHEDTGGGGGGNRGCTAEKIVFLSIPPPPLSVRATSAATSPAFPANVGSVYPCFIRTSKKWSNLSGPPTMAPVMTLGFLDLVSRHFHPPVHEYLLWSQGIDAARWWTCLG